MLVRSRPHMLVPYYEYGRLVADQLRARLHDDASLGRILVTLEEEALPFCRQFDLGSA